VKPQVEAQAQDLHARVFKSLLLQSDLLQREDRGELPRSADPAAPPLLGSFAEYFSRELRDRAERMTYVYSLFYCFENAVRELVAQRLEERKGPGWWESTPQGVQRNVEKKKNDAEENKWHQATVDSNIDYTLFGDLADIMQKEWAEFTDLFPSQPWVKQRLDELERSRNIIAHGNLLSEPEIERIEQYLGDWLRQVP
jgi:hypothetical protein